MKTIDIFFKRFVLLSLFLLLSKLSYSQWFLVSNTSEARSIAFVADDTVYTCANVWNGATGSSSATTGYVYRNGTLIAQSSGTPGGSPISNLFFINKDTGFFLTQHTGNSYISHTNDGGISWVGPFCSSLSGGPIQCYQFLSPQTGFAIVAMGPPAYFKRCINGNFSILQFTAYKLESTFKVYFVNENIGFLLTRDSLSNFVIARTTDQGTTWNTVSINSTRSYRAIHFPSFNNGFALGNFGRLYKTTDNGINWTESIIDSTIVFNDIFFINDSCGFVVGNSGKVYYTDNSGISWQQQAIPTTNNLIKVVFVNDSVGFISSLSGPIYNDGPYFKTTNRGIVGVKEIITNETLSFNVFPNPNKGIFNVVIPSELLNKKDLMLNIYSNEGRLIQQIPVEINQEKVKINLEAEAKGLYNVTLGNSKKMYSGKIIFE